MGSGSTWLRPAKTGMEDLESAKGEHSAMVVSHVKLFWNRDGVNGSCLAKDDRPLTENFSGAVFVLAPKEGCMPPILLLASGGKDLGCIMLKLYSGNKFSSLRVDESRGLDIRNWSSRSIAPTLIPPNPGFLLKRLACFHCC
jgi:hypothetical protein